MQNLLKSAFIVSALAIGFGASASDILTGTPIGTNPSAASNAFDTNYNTVYRANKASYAWVGLDLGEKHVITSVGWRPSGNTKAVLLGVFQGANNPDFSDAVPLYIIPDAGQYGRMDSQEVYCSRGFRYVRYVGPADSYCEIADVQFIGDKGAGDDSHLCQLTNLPTVVINTVNDEIPYDKEHDISSTVIIISENGSNILEKSETSIRERGNYSRTFPKKPYRIKFDKKQNVLDAPAKAKKWTLINNYGDKTLMRNRLAFDIAEMMDMEYVPYCTFVDVILNGEYKGCYQLCDQVEVNTGRVDIDEMAPEDVSGEALTGGYFIEIDAYADQEVSWFTSAHYGLPITIKSPDEDEIVPAQKKYISDYFNTLENKMKDTDPVTGYRSMFDNESFIQHMLVNEMAGNTDCYWSTYMYKKRGNPIIYTGPVWDFDLGFNNDDRTYPVTTRSGNGFLWNTNYASHANGMIYFAQRILIKDESTADEILKVWTKARRNGLNADNLITRVEQYYHLLGASQELNFKRWPILNERVHQNPRVYGSWEGELNAVKDYIRAQVKHLDDVVGFDPESLDDDAVIEVVADDNDAPIEYFNLQGLRVDKPSGGLYIMRKGNHSTKVLLP